MLLIIKFLAKILSILNGEVSPKQIAAGFAWGALIGLLPIAGLMPYVCLLLAFVVNVNLAILFVAAALFKLFAFLIDPVSNQIGFALLTKIPALQGFWTQLYNMPLVPYTRFNNTIVMGSLAIGLALLIPFYFAAKWGVIHYRTRLREKVLKTKLMQAIRASTFYRYYESFRGLQGD